MKNNTVKLLRYPGGKQKLLDFLLKYLPKNEEINGFYVEPFVGGAAVFFAINPESALLSDKNIELINLYKCLRKSPKKIWKIFMSYPADKDAYYQIRDYGHQNNDKITKAARMLYLNRTCFKGMWRHNANGDFNVGYGGEDRRWAISEENLIEVSRRLKKAKLRVSDFAPIINQCKRGDFIFLDPPYRPGELEMAHAHYVHGGFTYKDHKRLAKVLNNATERGVKWALTTSSHPDILQLFERKNIIMVPKGTSGRLGIQILNAGEVLIRNYSNKNEEIFSGRGPSKSSVKSLIDFLSGRGSQYYSQ